MKKKLLSLILVVALLIAMIPVQNVFAESTEEVTWTEIRTIEDLWAVRDNPSGNYKLMNDLDISQETAKGGSWDRGFGWTPIEEFSGIFDGNGYRIIGMNIYGTPSVTKIGLFGEINRAIIKNLGMKDVHIDVQMNKRAYIGAIVGDANGGYIEQCFAAGNINVAGEEEGIDCAGILGYADSYEGYVSIKNTLNLCTIRAAGESCVVSGIASGSSYDDDSSMNTSYNRGSLSSNGKKIYALAPNLDSYYSENNYYLISDVYKGTSAGSDKAGCHVGLTETQMKNKSSYTGFDFKDTWRIDPYSSYPYPQLKRAPVVRVSGIEIIQMPTNTAYEQGEEIDISGAKVKLIYEDGYTTEVLLNRTVLESSDFSVSYDNMKLGVQDAILSYGDATAKIPVTFDGVEVDKVTVSAPVENVSFGETVQFSAAAEPKEALDNEITWSCTTDTGTVPEAADAVITEDGKFTGNTLGTYIVKATCPNGVSGTYTITVTKPTFYLILEQNELKLEKEDSEELILTRSPLDSTEDIVWSSSNEAIATVEDGIVQAVGAGKATITAKTQSGAKVTCTVTVTQSVESCDFAGISKQEYIGKTVTLPNLKVYNGTSEMKKGKDYTVKYKNNTKVGTATVIITGTGYYSGSIEKTFKIVKGDDSAYRNAKISETSAYMIKGDTKTLKITGAKLSPQWSSSNKSIATVDSNGKVKAKKAGKATITAKVGLKTLKCTIIVNNTYKVDKTYLTIKKGSKATLKVTYNGWENIYWDTDNDSVISPSWIGGWNGNVAKLKVSAKKAGTAKLILTNDDNKEKLIVTVKVVK